MVNRQNVFWEHRSCPARVKHAGRYPDAPENVFSTDLLFLGERHECQWLHGLILQNSSKLLILHVLWDLNIDEGKKKPKKTKM